MNSGRLTTNKNNKQVEISADRINAVLSTPPFYVYKDGARYETSGRRVSTKNKVTLVDTLGKELVFDSLIECSNFLNIDRKRLARYANTDKLLICNNNKYIVKR